MKLAQLANLAIQGLVLGEAGVYLLPFLQAQLIVDERVEEFIGKLLFRVHLILRILDSSAANLGAISSSRSLSA